MTSRKDAFSELQAGLDEAKAKGWEGRLSADLASLLQEIWPCLQKDDSTNLQAWKLSPDRIENPVWSPPLLRFSIERHGATALGSTRAEVHEWVVDLKNRRAEIVKNSRRQLYQMAPRYRPEKDCEKIVQLVAANEDHPWLKWSSDRSRVTVQIGSIVPGGNSNQTETARRKRFREKLEPMMAEIGWVQTRMYNSYQRKDEAVSNQDGKND